jgi:hypothetical protein
VRIAYGVSCHFLLAQKVTKKGTTNANRLIGLVAHGYTPEPTNITVRSVRGQAARRLIILIFLLSPPPPIVATSAESAASQHYKSSLCDFCHILTVYNFVLLPDIQFFTV